MGRILNLQEVEAALKPGSVSACGGEWTGHGREPSALAVTFGCPELVSTYEVPDDAWIATAATIGTPG